MAEGANVGIGVGLFAKGALAGFNTLIGKVKGFTKTLSVAGKVAGAFGTAIAIVGAIHVRNSIQEFIKFEQQLAGLQKVMNDFDAASTVARSVGELSRQMPIASEQMFEVAETAARLGIRGVRNITEFTRVASMMGAATDLSAEKAADAFARILKQTETPISQFETLGSVVNELSNTMATTTSEIVDSMRRAAPELARIGLQAPEIAAFAASLNEVSESATRAGTRLRRFAQDLSDPGKAQAWADALGVTATSFRRILQSDPVGTMQRIIQVFSEGGVAARRLSGTLDARVRLALAALSANAEGTTRALEKMKEQVAGPDSLQKEFNIFANTTQSHMQRVQNSIDELQRRTGRKVIVMKRAWESLKLAILDVFIPDIDPLEAFALDEQRVKDFERRIRDSIEQATDSDITFEGFEFGFTTTQEQAEATVKTLNRITGELADALGTLEFGGEDAFDLLENLLPAALERVARNTNLVGTEAEALAQQQDVIDFFRRLAQVTEDAGTKTKKFVNTEVAKLKRTAAQMAADQVLTLDEIDTLQRRMNEIVNEASKLAQDDRSIQSMLDWSEALEKVIIDMEDETTAANRTARQTFILSEEFLNAGVATREQALAMKNLTEQQGRALTKYNEWQTALQLEADRDRAQSLSEQNDRLRDQVLVSGLLTQEGRKQVASKLEIMRLEEELAEMVERNADEQLIAEKRREIALRESLRLNEQQFDVYQKQLEKQREIAKEEEKINERMRERIERMRLLTREAQFDFLTRSIERMGDAAVDAFQKIISGSEGAGKAVLDMINQIANELLKKQLVGFLLGLIPTPGGGGGQQALDVSGFDEFGIPKFFASGGAIRANQLAIVGEEGPEIFVPRVAGTVMSNKDSRNAMSSDNYSVSANFTINAVDGADAKRVLAQNKDFITGMVTESISRSRSLKKQTGLR